MITEDTTGVVEVEEGDDEMEELIEKYQNAPTVTLLGRHFQTIQRLRMAFEATRRTRKVDDGRIDSIIDVVGRLEREVVKYLNDEASTSSIHEWLNGIKGIGPRLGGMLIALIDIRRSENVSQLWRYAGYAVINGARERRVKGEKMHYNNTLKRTCYLIVDSFIKCHSEPYDSFYRAKKQFYLEKRPEWQQNPKAPKKHCELAARRATAKLFLQHLWVEWRTREGLSTNEPYVKAIMGHGKMIEASRTE